MSIKTLPNEDISAICCQLSLLLSSGISTADAFMIMADDELSPKTKELLLSMGKLADNGEPIHDIFTDSKCFPEHVCGLVAVGERSGRIEESLTALSRYYSRKAELEERVRSSLLYPSVLLLIMLSVIVVLLVYVLPIFNDVYIQLGSALTGIAGGLLSLGMGLSAIMPYLCAFVALAVAALAFFSVSSSFRNKITAFWNRHCGGKGVSGKINTSRFADAMSIGLSSGLPMEEAIILSCSLLSDIPEFIRRRDKCLDMLSGGSVLSKSMSESGLLPKGECRILDAGIRSGHGDEAMQQIAERLSVSSEAALEERVERIEPTLVVATSLLVGLILLSVMLPLMNIMSSIG